MPANWEDLLEKQKEFHAKKRREIKRWQYVHWTLFTVNTVNATSSLLNHNWGLLTIDLLAVSIAVFAILESDKWLKTRFFEKE